MASSTWNRSGAKIPSCHFLFVKSVSWRRPPPPTPKEIHNTFVVQSIDNIADLGNKIPFADACAWVTGDHVVLCSHISKHVKVHWMLPNYAVFLMVSALLYSHFRAFPQNKDLWSLVPLFGTYSIRVPKKKAVLSGTQRWLKSLLTLTGQRIATASVATPTSNRAASLFLGLLLCFLYETVKGK